MRTLTVFVAALLLVSCVASGEPAPSPVARSDATASRLAVLGAPPRRPATGDAGVPGGSEHPDRGALWFLSAMPSRPIVPLPADHPRVVAIGGGGAAPTT